MGAPLGKIRSFIFNRILLGMDYTEKMQITRSLPSSFSPPMARSMAEPKPSAAQSVMPSDSVSLSSALSETREKPILVDVAHQRELRGAWVASVWNINFPSSTALSGPEQQKEMITMLEQLKDCGFNAVFFQVRPEGDALYKSELEPWGISLTGSQGKDPGYDPLALLVDEAKKRNIEVHAWLNPYRAASQAKTQVSPHLAVTHPEHVHQYGNVKWMDPGAEVVQERLVDVCKDIAERYDVDGIHFDDYFYPYPDGTPFPDDTTYTAYKKGGGTLSRDDWRRDNVNKAVKSVDEALEEKKDYIRFGISPFGLPAPDRPKGIVGFDQYEGLYADTQKWMDEGWVDYLAPQLYWPTNKKGQPYEPLVKWWNDHSSGGRAIFPGNNLHAVGSSPHWSIQEFEKQIKLTREHSKEGGAGNIWWNVGPILKNSPGVKEMFQKAYAEPALSPVMPEARELKLEAPQVTLEGREITVRAADDTSLRGWTVYKQEYDQWRLAKVIPAGTRSFELEPGAYAIAAASRQGVESKGVVVEIPA